MTLEEAEPNRVGGRADVDAAVLLEEAREACHGRDWVTALARFADAQAQAPLEADDLAALASCAWWLGDLDRSLPALEEAHHRYVDDGRHGPAAMAAMELGYTLALRGEAAQGSGWIRRAMRLLDGQPEGAAHGYLEYIVGWEGAYERGDLEGALTAADRVRALGRRAHDPTLRALGVLGQGEVLLRQGRVDDGMALLDEAMVAAVSDELDPAWAGHIYCRLMLACEEIADLRRAGEWTEVTTRWCERLTGTGPFMGLCRVHRAQVLQVQGAWAEAEQEVVRVCEGPAHFGTGIVGEAHYRLGELRRQRGDLQGAEEAFRAGRALGRDPQPGFALLRLASGSAEAALASITSALAAAGPDPLARARLLPAAVEVALAAGDLGRAAEACEELGRTAAVYGTSGFAAHSLQAQGIMRLAEGDAGQALAVLRHALRAWHELGAVYEAAQVRLALADAYEAAGDPDAAALEREAAGAAHARLGVVASGPDAGVAAPAGRPGGLTPREAEVLAMVATGKTNQQIAAELVLSIRTVERHLATVYEKLGVSGRSARAAAVSFALREGLLAE